MKKILYLTLISAPIFSMQSDEKVKTVKKDDTVVQVTLLASKTAQHLAICDMPVPASYKLAGFIVSAIAYQGAKEVYNRYYSTEAQQLENQNKK